MAVTEAQIQAAVQTTFQGISAFQDADVVINDWTILDGPSSGAPYVIIVPADTVRSLQESSVADTTYEVPFWFFESFVDWKETLDNFVIRRQAIIDEFNQVGTDRSPGADGTVIVNMTEIRNDGPVTEWYDRYLSPDMQATAMPDYIAQRMILQVRVY